MFRTKDIPKILLLVLVGLITNRARADVVVLDNGNRIRGQVIQETKQFVTLKLPYGNMQLPRRQVVEIIKESDEKYLRETGKQLESYGDSARAIELLREAHGKNASAEGVREALEDALLSEAERNLAENRLEAAAKIIAELESLSRVEELTQELRSRLAAGETARATLSSEARRLAQEKPLQALPLYVQLVETYPEDRDDWRNDLAALSVIAGHHAMRAEEWGAARDHYHRALENQPDTISHIRLPLVVAQVQCARPLLESRRFKEARLSLLETLGLLPDEHAVLYHLGLAYEGEGRFERAADAYARIAGPERKTINGASDLDRLRRLAEARMVAPEGSSGSMTSTRSGWKPEAGASGQILESRDFVIHHGISRKAVKEVEATLQHHVSRLRKNWFGGVSTPRFHRITVHLHSDRKSYEKSTSAPSWSHGYTMVARRYGNVTGVDIHFDLQHPQFLTTVIPHELAHSLLPYRLGGNVPSPLWLEEGLATCEEPAFKQAYYQRVTIEALEERSLLPLEVLFALEDYPEGDRAATVLYAQCNSVVRFLQARLGARQVFPTLSALARGTSDDTIRSATRYQDVHELEGAWKRWLRKLQ